MIDLYFATSNPHKWDEARAILAPEVKLFAQEALKMAACPEPHATLSGNAQTKLMYVLAQRAGDAFAEDTGLFVEALDGAPGVYSRRYAHRAGSALDNVAYLLSQLRGQKARQASFRTAVALHYRGQLYTFEGVLNGTIAEQPKGKGGFGYDALFIPAGYDKSLAALPIKVKNAISHRQKALAALKSFLISAGA